MRKKISKKIKIILIVLCIIILLFILYLFANIANKKVQENKLNELKEKVSQYTTISDFQNIEEVMAYLDITYINTENCEEENIDYIINIKSKYKLNLDNKKYFENLIHYSAYALKYKNFVINDKEENIEILVICSEKDELISQYIINNESFYFNKIESDENIKQYSKTNITKVENYSEIIKNIISNNWKTTNLELGTKDSAFNGYDIYFDEGYEIKKINGKIFNLIFTSKYNETIIENLKVNSNKENIIKTLGKPTFEQSKYDGELIGYKTEEFYIFFYQDQISIYPIITYNNNELIEIQKLAEQNKNENNITKYINEVKKIWQDYNLLEVDTNSVIIEYVLKGVKLQYDNSDKRGIIVYKNYMGNISENLTIEDSIINNIELPSNIYFVNEDLVYVHEQNRIEYMSDYSEKRNYAYGNILNTSKKFKALINKDNSVSFVSINKKTANSELRESITYGIWLNDSEFAYSIKNKGIYIYNAESREYKTLVEGKDEFSIIKIENKKLYYDNTYIQL